MRKKKEESANFLEFIPIPSDKFDVKVDQNGKITILKENTGAINRLFQLLFKKPEISQVHLDEMGNFIWPLMDGKRDVMAIALLVKDEFGDKAEPLYERISQYFKILESYGFITINRH